MERSFLFVSMRKFSKRLSN